MGREIHRHQFSITQEKTIVPLHQYAKFLHVDKKDSAFWFWEEHLTGLKEKYTDEPLVIMEDWVFTVIGTGQSIPDDAGEYIGTVIDGYFVWHLYGARQK